MIKFRKILGVVLGMFCEIEVDCEVRAEGLSRESVEQAIQNEIIQKMPIDNFRLQINTWSSAWDNTTDLPIKVTALSFQDNNKRFRAAIQHGTVQKTIVGSIVRKIKLPVLAQALGGENPVDTTTLQFEEFDEDKLSADVIVMPQDLAGMKVKAGRVIKAFTPMRKGDFEKPIVVRKGDRVRVIVIDPMIEVSTVAFAKANGSVGDHISFEVSGKKVIQAVVVSEGRAEIRQAVS